MIKHNNKKKTPKEYAKVVVEHIIKDINCFWDETMEFNDDLDEMTSRERSSVESEISKEIKRILSKYE